MITAGSGHTATLLADGRVLIAGGGLPSSDLLASPDILMASAELYDPATGTFTATGDMVDRQFWHTATLLTNGKVLIARGLSYVPAFIAVRAELYDPLTGGFDTTGAYAGSGTACDFCTTEAPLLPDGKVFIQGEWEAQLYEPVMGTFGSEGRALLPGHMTATLLTNGKVLLAGGESDFGRASGAEIYDPAERLFTFTGNMACGRGWHTSTLLPDGIPLVAGRQTHALAPGSPPPFRRPALS